MLLQPWHCFYTVRKMFFSDFQRNFQGGETAEWVIADTHQVVLCCEAFLLCMDLNVYMCVKCVLSGCVLRSWMGFPLEKKMQVVNQASVTDYVPEPAESRARARALKHPPKAVEDCGFKSSFAL
mmetsp:Transcript_11087/g.19872  ORF Transcript_11087/g.19872 Transcript_11087/m.19872 type:complete len:124 (-) Transcript_11087:157-528(-)